MKLEVFDEHLSLHREASIEQLHPIGVEEMSHEVEPSAPDVGTKGVSGNQLEEAPRASKDATGPSVEDTQPSEPVNESEVHGPTTSAELVVSPQASPSMMAHGASIGPWRSERQGPSREITEGIEEIDREPPHPWVSPPWAARTFLRRGDMLEVMEEEEANK